MPLYHPLTHSGVQAEAEGGRRQPQPPVQLLLQMFLEKLLSLIVLDEGQVSTTALTPALCAEEAALQRAEERRAGKE